MKINNITGCFYISIPNDFNFWRTIFSHGWCVLKPFSIDKENKILNRLFTLRDGELIYCSISENQKKLKIRYALNKKLTLHQKKELINQIKQVFRIEEDFTDFFNMAKKDKKFNWVDKIKAGRLLRSPTVFEDVVKMICTTNCSWSLTEIMINNIISKLGRKYLLSHPDGKLVKVFSFPNYKNIASVNEKFLREEIKAGYRAPYLLELAKNVKNGVFDLETLRNNNILASDLFHFLKGIKGIGPYAAGNLLKLLGKYDYLGIDSWSRGKFFKLHKNGRKVSDKKIEKFYESYGKWRGLFFWLDVTKHWYNKQFPF